MTYLDHGPFGPETRCEPGETTYPSACQRHPAHYWCPTCRGYYGVPHDGGIHTGRSAHPNHRGVHECACRVCKDHVAALVATTSSAHSPRRREHSHKLTR